MKKIRIGLIGFGSMGKTHTYAIRNLPFFYRELSFEAEVVAVTTAHEDTARKAAELYGIPHVMKSERELIESDLVDVVDICSPNRYHYEAIMSALEKSKPIYCEKPLCTTYEEARRAAAFAKEKGVTAQIVFNNRYLAPIMRARALIEEGRLGRILSFRGEYLHTSAAFSDRPIGWKQDREICGGGVLFDLGSHVIDLIYYLCGAFESVTGVSQIAYPERIGRDGNAWKTNADEAFYLLAKLECGAIGSIEVSKVAIGTNDDLKIEVRGTRGALRFSLMDPNFLEFFDGEEPEATLGGERGYKRIECVGRYPAPGGVFPGIRTPNGWLRGHVGSMYDFLCAVHEGRKASPSFEDAAHVQWVMEEAYKADKKGIFTR